MRAVLCTSYGPPEVLELREVARPAPRKGEVLVAVHATAVTTGDCRMRRLDLSGVPALARLVARCRLGVTRPKRPIPGLCLAGRIAGAGEGVRRFAGGDAVYAETTPGLRFGAYAEYVCLPEGGLVAPIPAGISWDEAVAVPFGGIAALHFLRRGRVRSGDRVLVHGASGAVGTAAVQLAKHLGAEVTGVCSAASAPLVRSLGADHAVDYTREDFTRLGPRFDIVLDTVGRASRAEAARVLTPGGRYLSVVHSGHGPRRVEDVALLFRLLQRGLLRPVIDRRYPLEQIVEAHRYVEAGHKHGNVVVTVRAAVGGDDR